MKKAEATVWGIETTLEDTGKKYLCWNYRDSKALYWTSDKKQMPPALFPTKADARQAIKRSSRSRERMPKGLFTNVYDGASTGKPVKVKVSVLN